MQTNKKTAVAQKHTSYRLTMVLGFGLKRAVQVVANV